MCVENKKKTLEEFKGKKYRVNDEVKWDQMVILMSVLLVLWHANSYCALPAAAHDETIHLMIAACTPRCASI